MLTSAQYAKKTQSVGIQCFLAGWMDGCFIYRCSTLERVYEKFFLNSYKDIDDTYKTMLKSVN